MYNEIVCDTSGNQNILKMTHLMEHIHSKKATYTHYSKGRADPGPGAIMCVNLSALNNGDNKPRDIHKTTNALLSKKTEVERGLGEATDVF